MWVGIIIRQLLLCVYVWMSVLGGCHAKYPHLSLDSVFTYHLFSDKVYWNMITWVFEIFLFSWIAISWKQEKGGNK